MYTIYRITNVLLFRVCFNLSSSTSPFPLFHIFLCTSLIFGNRQPNPVSCSSHLVLLVHRQSRIVPLDQLSVHPLRIQERLYIFHMLQIHLGRLLFQHNLLDYTAIDPWSLHFSTIQLRKLLIDVFRRQFLFDCLELLVLQLGLTVL